MFLLEDISACNMILLNEIIVFVLKRVRGWFNKKKKFKNENRVSYYNLEFEVQENFNLEFKF